jgi:hypothetical protein
MESEKLTVRAALAQAAYLAARDKTVNRADFLKLTFCAMRKKPTYAPPSTPISDTTSLGAPVALSCQRPMLLPWPPQILSLRRTISPSRM